MGYQVGLTCYATKAEAENAYFSAVSPVISPDGKLIQPIYNGLSWQLQGQAIQAYLPECNVIDSFKDGQLIGWSVFSILAAVWGIKLVRERLRL